MSYVDLGGVSPMGERARRRWRQRLRPVENPVRKVSGRMGGARLAGGSFQRGAAPRGRGRPGPGRRGGRGGRGRGRHRGRHRHGSKFFFFGGGYPYYYPYYYPYSLYPYYYGYPYGYGYGYPAYGYGYGYPTYPTYEETVPSSCCYNVRTGSLYCPGSEYDGAPAYAEATRMYQGRPMSFVTSPKLGQAQWFWNCPTEAEPSAMPGLSAAPRPPSSALPGGPPSPPRLRARNRLRFA